MDVFHVLTEFRFDAGSAIAESKALQGQVERLSGAADSALFSFQRLSLGIVAHMGLGVSGIAGAIYEAVHASDKFYKSQLAFSNIMMSNTNNAMSFHDAMIGSSEVMEHIRMKAQQFSLPVGPMVDLTKTVGASLMAHGMDDTSFRKSTDISRMFLKSAPILNIDPSMATGQLLDAVNGRASMGDTLFQRLSNETQAMKPFGGSAQGFNALTPEKRLVALTKALAQFSSNAQVVEANARSLSGEMQRFGDLLKGPFAILKPVGDSILSTVMPAFKKFNDYLQGPGREMSKHLGNMVKDWFTDIPRVFATLSQVKNLSSDLSLGGKVMKTVGELMFFKWILDLVGVRVPYASRGLDLFGKAINTLTKDVFGGAFRIAKAMPFNFSSFAGFFASVMKNFWYLLDGLVVLITDLLAPLALLVGLFQLFSRAFAYAKEFAAINILSQMPALTAAMEKISAIWSLFDEGFDTIARGLGHLLDPTKLFGFIDLVGLAIGALDIVGTMMTLVVGGIQGLMFAFMQMIVNLVNWVGSKFGKDDIMGKTMGIGEAFNAGVDSVMERVFKGMEDGSAAVQMTTNIGKVEIANQFKENAEPDRIAITLKNQLLKTAQNPTQGRGRSFAASGV